MEPLGDTTTDHDYRQSHLGKGADYDASLAQTPFDAYMTRHEREILARLIRELFPNRIPQYLDFACGTGRITSVVEDYADASYGVDVSDNMLAQAKARCTRTTFLVTDLTRDTRPLGPFNLITAFRFFGNAEDELRRAVLNRLSGLLAPGGYLIFNNHRNPWSVRNLITRLRGQDVEVDLSPRKTRRLLQAAGLDVVRSCGIGAWVIRDQLRQEGPLTSPMASRLEPISRLPFLAAFCPDAVIVARKEGVGVRP